MDTLKDCVKAATNPELLGPSDVLSEAVAQRAHLNPEEAAKLVASRLSSSNPREVQMALHLADFLMARCQRPFALAASGSKAFMSSLEKLIIAKKVCPFVV